MDGTGIPILRILDQKDHEEGDDCRSSIDNKLPSIRIVVSWTESCPDNNRTYRQTKSPREPTRTAIFAATFPNQPLKASLAALFIVSISSPPGIDGWMHCSPDTLEGTYSDGRIASHSEKGGTSTR